jgi:hypothetical protein
MTNRELREKYLIKEEDHTEKRDELLEKRRDALAVEMDNFSRYLHAVLGEGFNLPIHGVVLCVSQHFDSELYAAFLRMSSDADLYPNRGDFNVNEFELSYNDVIKSYKHDFLVPKQFETAARLYEEKLLKIVGARPSAEEASSNFYFNCMCSFAAAGAALLVAALILQPFVAMPLAIGVGAVGAASLIVGLGMFVAKQVGESNTADAAAVPQVA